MVEGEIRGIEMPELWCMARVVPIIVLLEHVPDFLRQRIITDTMDVLAVEMPASGIVCNVASDGMQGAVGADDAFIVVALPDGCTRRIAHDVDAPGNDRFE
jgi:hypothetical protein